MLTEAEESQSEVSCDTRDVCEELALQLRHQLRELKECIDALQKQHSEGIERLKGPVSVGRSTLTAMVQIQTNEEYLVKGFFSELIQSEWLRLAMEIPEGLPLPKSEATERFLTPVTEALEHNARARFASRRSKREADLMEVPELDFLGLLRWLKQGYSGLSGRRRIYSDAAKGLIDEFGLKHKEFTESKSSVTLEVRSYCDQWDKEHGRYSYQSEEMWKRICRLLGLFFEAAGLARPAGLCGSLGVAPGKTIEVSKDLRLRCHYTSVKMQMSHGLAAQLRAFLGEYGAS